MFSIVEGHLLQRRRACRWKERSVAAEISWQLLSFWLVFIPSQRTILSFTEDISFSLWGHFFFSQKYTEKQNTQRPTETLSQPISQNVTANLSWNVLWILYAEGLLWARNVRQKNLLNLWVLWEKEIPTVRERDTHSERKNYPQWEKEQPKNLVSSPIGVTSHTTPLPSGEGTGEGPALFGIKSPLQGLKQRSKKKA